MKRFPGTQHNQMHVETEHPATGEPSTAPVFPEKPMPVGTDHSSDKIADVLDPGDGDDEAYVEGDNIYFSTGDVAQRLGISRDMTRNHMKDFEEFLHIVYSRSQGRYAHMRLLSTDMDLLEKIVRLRKNGFSVEHVKQVLQDPDLAGAMHAPTVDISAALSEMFALNNAALLSEMKKLIDSSTKQTQLLLENNEKKDQQIESLTHEVDHLKQMLLDQTIEMRHQSETVDSIQASIQEQLEASAKKKGFWSLFR